MMSRPVPRGWPIGCRSPGRWPDRSKGLRGGATRRSRASSRRRGPRGGEQPRWRAGRHGGTSPAPRCPRAERAALTGEAPGRPADLGRNVRCGVGERAVHGARAGPPPGSAPPRRSGGCRCGWGRRYAAAPCGGRPRDRPRVDVGGAGMAGSDPAGSREHERDEQRVDHAAGSAGASDRLPAEPPGDEDGDPGGRCLRAAVQKHMEPHRFTAEAAVGKALRAVGAGRVGTDRTA